MGQALVCRDWPAQASRVQLNRINKAIHQCPLLYLLGLLKYLLFYVFSYFIRV